MNKKIGDIKKELVETNVNQLDDFIKEYESDERGGVKSLVAKARKMQDDLEKEKKINQYIIVSNHKFYNHFVEWKKTRNEEFS